MRSSVVALLAVLLVASASGCDDEASFVKVSVYASEGDCNADAAVPDAADAADEVDGGSLVLPRQNGAFADADRLRVEVASASGNASTLLYEHRSGDGIKCFDGTHPVTFSVSFDQGHSTAPVVLKVTALDSNGRDLGAGMTYEPVVLRKGAVVEADVVIARAFSGCDPAATSGSESCGANQTCHIECTSETSTCVAAGPADRGQLCESTSDCKPGLECLAYCSTTSVCVKPCSSNSDCGADSFCTNPVNCGATGDVPSGRFVCSLGCNPLGKTSGCPQGSMYCGLIGATETVDCVCRLPTQTGTDGVACSGYSGCAPGFMCVQLQGSPDSCRALCKLGAADACPNGGACAKLTGYDTFGVCL